MQKDKKNAMEKKEIEGKKHVFKESYRVTK